MEIKKRNNLWILVLLVPVFLSPAWYFTGGCLLMFIGFVPLFILEQGIRNTNAKYPKLKFFGYTYTSLFLWNVATTWWVWNASAGGAIGMLIANTLIMTLPWVLYSQIKQKLGLKWGLWALVCFWLAFEYIHLNWDLSWSWLNLGNGFAYSHALVQWYEFTGSLGGTLWVLILNILFYQSMQEGFSKKALLRFSFVLFIPIVVSLVLYAMHTEKGEGVEVVVVQPNIDPYSQKFVGQTSFIPYDKQARMFLELAQKQITNKTELIVFPETAFDEGYDERGIKDYMPIRIISDFLKSKDNLYLLGGTTSWLIYGENKRSFTARQNAQVGFYDVFNTAMFFGNKVDSIALYHKSKLVPLVESMPYPAVIETIFGSLIINLGGSSGGLGKQPEREVFFSKKFGYAPIICYESVYGEYVTEYVQKGANILCVITNDGWWGDTPGYKQHLQMARLRAIETRRAVARSANTGISGFINQRGDIIEKTAYWVSDVRKQTLQANTEKTIYVRLGDILGKIAVLVSFLMIIYSFIKKKVS
jgi:apolipoprotein N-acyltransferase